MQHAHKKKRPTPQLLPPPQTLLAAAYLTLAGAHAMFGVADINTLVLGTESSQTYPDLKTRTEPLEGKIQNLEIENKNLQAQPSKLKVPKDRAKKPTTKR
jgi:hypothetical protein